MPSTNRISVTTASATHQKLLEYEAALTGRSISSLASSLLEEIVNQKLQAGNLHPTAVRLSEELVKAREWGLKSDHEGELAVLRTEPDAKPDPLAEQWEKVLGHMELPSSRMLLSQKTRLIELNDEVAVLEVHAPWMGMVESRLPLLQKALEAYVEDAPCPRIVLKSDGAEQVQGYFTDQLWAASLPADIEPNPDPEKAREEELVAYGMRYGLEREVAEDLYEYWGEKVDASRFKIREEMRKAADHEEWLPEGKSVGDMETEEEDDCPF